MENGMMNGDHYNGHERSRSPSPGLSRSNSRNASCKEINRTSLLRRNQSLSAKQIRFYRNGDRFFCGLKLAVSPERYKEFDALLAELSNKLELSTGAVRFVFNAENGKMITDVNELQYGSSYVCSSCNVFKEVEGGYGSMKPSWSLAHHKKENAPTSSPSHQIDGSRDFIKPKLVTVMKNGKPPQKKVTMLLNAKTAVSLEQVLDHLSSKGTLGKVDKLHTVDGKQIRELRHLFNDDTMFVALQSHEKFPEEGFDVDVQRFYPRPRWRYAPVTDTYSYIPGLRPEPPPPEKKFTVHLHCILAASMSNLTLPKPLPVRARSVSPRPSRKSFSPSPKSIPRSSASFTPQRPKTALGVPSEFSRKSLMPQAKENGTFRPAKKKAGSDKPVPIRPKAGSDTPVAIRGRLRPSEPKVFMPLNDSQTEDPESENAEGRHGYYIYIYNEKINKSQGLQDGKPTASVRPMMFSKDDQGDVDPVSKLDLKPMTLNLSPVDSLETITA